MVNYHYEHFANENMRLQNLKTRFDFNTDQQTFDNIKAGMKQSKNQYNDLKSRNIKQAYWWLDHENNNFFSSEKFFKAKPKVRFNLCKKDVEKKYVFKIKGKEIFPKDMIDCSEFDEPLFDMKIIIILLVIAAAVYMYMKKNNKI